MATVAFDKTKPKPRWLVRPPRSESSGYAHAYYNRLWERQPRWADPKAIRRLYRIAARMRAEGHDVEVDHIVPLRHPFVSGLHCEANLQIVPRRFNQWKSNGRYHFHPQLELFEECDPFWTLQQPKAKP